MLGHIGNSALEKGLNCGRRGCIESGLECLHACPYFISACSGGDKGRFDFPAHAVAVGTGRILNCLAYRLVGVACKIVEDIDLHARTSNRREVASTKQGRLRLFLAKLLDNPCGYVRAKFGQQWLDRQVAKPSRILLIRRAKGEFQKAPQCGRNRCLVVDVIAHDSNDG